MEEKKIYKAISAVMEDIGAVGKNQKNTQQGFMFRSIDAVMNAINPALIKNKVFIVPEVLEQRREERQGRSGGNLIYSICKMKYTFFTDDGSSIEAVVIGEGMDSGDKATNKAMSIAFKYACFQVFCIPTEEMKDPDEERYSVGPKKSTVTQEQIEELHYELKRTGIGTNSLLKNYGVNDISELSLDQYSDAIKKLKNKPNKKDVQKQQAEQMAKSVENMDDSGLPWK